MDTLRLAVPDRAPDSGAAAFFNASRLKTWLEALPLANSAKTGEELLKALQQVNRAEASMNQRYNFLDQCRPIVADLLEALYKQYASAAVPLAEKQRSFADLAHGLLNEMANGYKIMVLATSDAKTSDSTRNILIASTLYAMHHLARLLVDLYSLYTPEPKNLWLELHQLYGLAEKEGFLTATFQKDGNDGGVRSIEHTYRRILMLTLANPYHLMQGEALLVFRELDNWAGTCKLSPMAADALPNGHLYLDLEKDAPPRYAPVRMKLAPPANGRILDIADVLPIIEEKTKELLISSKTESGQLNLAGRKLRNMYKRLAEAWGVRAERKSERKQKSMPIEIVAGVSACHHFASGGAEFNPEISELEIRKGKQSVTDQSGLSLLEEQDTPWMHEDQAQRINTGLVQPRTSQFATDHDYNKDVWDKIYSTKTQFQHQKSENNGPGFVSTVCQLRDESTGGMAIACKKAQGTRLIAGEIIGFKSENSPDPENWSIGIVRWLRATPPDKLDLGILSFADSIQPVATRGIKGVGKGSEYFRSLLISGANNTQSASSLVTPAAVFDVDSVIFVNTGTELFYAKLTKLVDATNAFSLFQFQIIDPPDNTQKRA